MKEPILEPFLRKMRIKKVLPVIKSIKNPVLLDIGCGWEAKFLKSIEPYISKGIGIDFKAPVLEGKKIKTLKMVIADRLPFDDSIFNIITMLAVLEHISEPYLLAKEISRICCWGGLLILTVPSKIAKPVLEFLSYLNIVNPKEIKDHKKYYNKKEIEELFAPYGFEIECHRYFQFGMNNFCILKKMK